VREGSSVEVKERCLDNSCGAREPFGLDMWTSTADLEDEGVLVWAGRVVDLTIEFSVFDDEVDRPTTMVALLLTLAFMREGSTGVDEMVLVLNGEGGREEGLDCGWRVTTLLVFTLAVTFMSCELLDKRKRPG
jgi:hypothetical protein